MSDYAAAELNSNICSTLVVSEESVAEIFEETEDDAVLLIDPDSTAIDYEEDIAADGEEAEALAELEGDEYAVAYCRALYDLNEMEGGFCCQTLAIEYPAEFESAPSYIPIMVEKTGVTAQEEDPIVVDIGVEVSVTWGAEAFASASGLAASAMTMAASLMVFTQ